jgi:PRTRC genetic system ThiF family protein
MQQLSYDYLDSKPILLPSFDRLDLYLIGCGGTGSWLAPSLCRIARMALEQGKKVNLTFIDPDRVKAPNILRQNFCDAEIGSNKAQTLAIRYSIAWGIEIGAITSRFDPKTIDVSSFSRYHPILTILIGCVDNAAARASIANTLEQNQDSTLTSEPTSLWWLDCGNSYSSGQVLLGSRVDPNPDTYQFHPLGCCRLPAPSIIQPDLLKPLSEELEDSNLSCAEIAMRNAQSLSINQRVAAEAADYLVRLINGKLNRFATYFNLASGSSSSLYTTPAAVKKALEHGEELKNNLIELALASGIEN